MGNVAASTSCKSCRHSLREHDQKVYARHFAVGLVHCRFDAIRGASLMRPLNYCCTRYDATDRRKAYLAAMEELKHETAFV
jgi:hypothetical protein